VALPLDPPRTVLRRDAVTLLPTRHGDFTAIAYVAPDGREHLALARGSAGDAPMLVRVHSECLTGDVFGSLRCDCGEQLERTLEVIAAAGRGVLVYLRQEGRGIGLLNKLRAYALQDVGHDTVEANEALGFGHDLRDYAAAAEILRDLGVTRVDLITNNPGKLQGLEDGGIEIASRVPIVIPANERNRRYLQTKRQKMGHLL